MRRMWAYDARDPRCGRCPRPPTSTSAPTCGHAESRRVSARVGPRDTHPLVLVVADFPTARKKADRWMAQWAVEVV